MAIDTVEGLRTHLDLATKVELSTIPPYLYAMYSIRDQDSDAARLIASVVVEEMLHVCLTANLLVAVGGEPDFGHSAVPRYPAPLAHHIPPLELSLSGCTVELTRDTFMVIERPKAPGAPPEDDNYETLGQFYSALELAFEALESTEDLFVRHEPSRQLADHSFYGPVKFDTEGSGGLVLVHDLASANEALEIIMHQGEGVSDVRWADPGHQELTHYFKFRQIAGGETPIGEVWPVLTSPRASELPSEIRPIADLFNASYELLFLTIGSLYTSTGDKSELVDRLYGLMTSCLAPTARYLVQQPVGGERTAGPTFEMYGLGPDPVAETLDLASNVAGLHPELAEVTSALAGF